MRVVLVSMLALAASGCVDAIDQDSTECESIMLPRVLAKARTMPANTVLQAKGAEIEHVFEGGEERTKSILRQVQRLWKSARAEPIDEITWGLFLREDAVDFSGRAEQRTKELCGFAEANRVKYDSWWLDAPEIADYTTQLKPVEPWQ